MPGSRTGEKRGRRTQVGPVDSVLIDAGTVLGKTSLADMAKCGREIAWIVEHCFAIRAGYSQGCGAAYYQCPNLSLCEPVHELTSGQFRVLWFGRASRVDDDVLAATQGDDVVNVADIARSEVDCVRQGVGAVGLSGDGSDCVTPGNCFGDDSAADFARCPKYCEIHGDFLFPVK